MGSTLDRGAVQPEMWGIRYASYLYQVAIRRLNDEAQAMDLVQETFLAGLEAIEKFERRSTEKTWLTRILLNKAVDSHRKKKSERNCYLNQLQHSNRGEMNCEDKYCEKEFMRSLECCLEQMPEMWSSVFRMKYLQDETAADICHQLNITASNFWTISHRTKLHLRKSLKVLF